jgi:hypothetical protein
MATSRVLNRVVFNGQFITAYRFRVVTCLLKHVVSMLLVQLYVQVFHFKVVLANREHHMFPNEVVLQMFSNIKSIYQFHHDFLLPQLEKRMLQW